MQETILNASARVKQGGKFREKGFVAGVIYGDGVTNGNMVKFDAAALNKVLSSHGSNARVSIMYENNKTLGFIKEVQRDTISKQITHVDVQIVAKDHEVKMQIPIKFIGEDLLAIKRLQLQVYKSAVSVEGMMNLMPDAIQVNVSEMQLGDSITIGNFALDKDLKVGDKEETVYAVINKQALGAEAAPENK